MCIWLLFHPFVWLQKLTVSFSLLKLLQQKNHKKRIQSAKLFVVNCVNFFYYQAHTPFGVFYHHRRQTNRFDINHLRKPILTTMDKRSLSHISLIAFTSFTLSLTYIGKMEKKSYAMCVCANYSFNSINYGIFYKKWLYNFLMLHLCACLCMMMDTGFSTLFIRHWCTVEFHMEFAFIHLIWPPVWMCIVYVCSKRSACAIANCVCTKCLI